MSLLTVWEMVQDGWRDGTGLPAARIPNDAIELMVSYYNKGGKKILDMWPWDERKIDVTEVNPDANGIITLDATVDIIIGLRPKETSSANNWSYISWPQTRINAFMLGQDITSGSLQRLAPDSSDNRRIKVPTDDQVATYYLLAYKRFVRATIESTYDAANPSATPTDYRVLTWPVSHTTETVIEYMADRARIYIGEDPIGAWQTSLEIEIDKITEQQADDEMIMPSDPMYSEQGFDYGTGLSTLRTV